MATDMKHPGNIQTCAPSSPFNSDYEVLRDVLDRAFEQASGGKGKERHAQNRPFDEQPMQQISELLSTDGGMAYQAIKKIQESRRMPETERKVAELLGAINYIAGMIIYVEKQDEQ